MAAHCGVFVRVWRVIDMSGIVSSFMGKRVMVALLFMFMTYYSRHMTLTQSRLNVDATS